MCILRRSQAWRRVCASQHDGLIDNCRKAAQLALRSAQEASCMCKEAGEKQHAWSVLIPLRLAGQAQGAQRGSAAVRHHQQQSGVPRSVCFDRFRSRLCRPTKYCLRCHRRAPRPPPQLARFYNATVAKNVTAAARHGEGRMHRATTAPRALPDRSKITPVVSAFAQPDGLALHGTWRAESVGQSWSADAQASDASRGLPVLQRCRSPVLSLHNAGRPNLSTSAKPQRQQPLAAGAAQASAGSQNRPWRGPSAFATRQQVSATAIGLSLGCCSCPALHTLAVRTAHRLSGRHPSPHSSRPCIRPPPERQQQLPATCWPAGHARPPSTSGTCSRARCVPAQDGRAAALLAGATTADQL
jgi:hypothetical protein